MTAVRQVYTLSYPLAFLLTLGGFLACGHRMRTRLNLESLARHNRIEHDGSLVHDDAPKGSIWAPNMPDHSLLEDLIGEGKDETEGMTIEHLVRVRRRRSAALRTPLSTLHADIMMGESAFIVETFADADGVINREVLKEWFGEERLADGWSGNVTGKTTGIIHLHLLGKKLSNMAQGDTGKKNT